MRRRDGRYTLRLELRDEEGRVMGELQVTLVGENVPADRPVGAEREERDERRREPSRDERRPRSEPRPRPFRGRDEEPTEGRHDRRAMTTEQRKLVFRLVYALGWTRDAATQKALETLRVERFEDATREDASAAIDALRAELERKDGGRSNGATHG